MTTWALDIAPGTATTRPPSARPAADGARPPTGEHRVAWDGVIDRCLIPWANGLVDIDDDLLPPTPASVRVAATLCHRFRDAGQMPPTAVLPNGDGGILFENRKGRASVQLEVLRDGDVERAEYSETGVISRDLYPAAQFD